MKFGSKSYFKIEKASVELSSMGVTKPTSDFNQWLHAMKMVAVLPGGMPSEFRKKLWLALADKYLQTRKINWSKEQIKCFSEQWRTDDEELGAQIVKDLHRTGSSLCSGPMGSSNQAKLKKVLVGYARWNAEIGYCQGFNMLGALILQVMDKNEADSIKIMILLIEGILPQGYFSGSLSGLQADMAVFRELLATKLPKLSKHLQKLQGPSALDNFEPPLINVFTMQWFLTLFCTCLPLNCVLRVWDLILIEGSDILLRTALTLWDLLEPRIMSIKTADDFYCKMGLISGEILNGSLIDTNGLIQKIVDLGAIDDLKQLREKHLYSISPLRDKKGIMLFYSDDDGESDNDSKFAVATAWEAKNGRRPSLGSTQNTRTHSIDNNKDRIALDISILKQQYAKIRERQRQAHIILTSACARQSSNSTSSSIPINQLLSGRNAILSRKGRRVGPPQGAIPPARKSVPNTNNNTQPMIATLNQSKTGETLHWKDTDAEKKRRNSIKWRNLKSDVSETDASTSPKLDVTPQSQPNTSKRIETKTTTNRKRSESSSYSEDSNDDDDSRSSTSTSLCDDENQKRSDASSYEQSPIKMKIKSGDSVPVEGLRKRIEELKPRSDNLLDLETQYPSIQSSASAVTVDDNSIQLEIPEPVTVVEEIPFTYSLDDHFDCDDKTELLLSLPKSNDSFIEILKDKPQYISSVSQLSPIPDISRYISTSNISPLKSPLPIIDFAENSSEYSPPDEILSTGIFDLPKAEVSPQYKVDEEGVTNEFFERINLVERPKQLDIIDVFTPSPLSYEIVPINTYDPALLVLDKIPLENQNMPNLPSCTDMSTVLTDTSAIAEIIPHSDAIPNETLTDKITQIKSHDTSVFLDRIRFSKIKSLSLDEAAKYEISGRVGAQTTKSNSDNSIIGKNSDKVLKIIQENSIILHRILKRNTSKYADSMIKYYDEKNAIEPNEPIVEPIVESSTKNDLFKDNLKNFGNSINLSETISSIENTIKSINKLCGKSEEVEKKFEFTKQPTIQLDDCEISLPIENCSEPEEIVSPDIAELSIISDLYTDDDEADDELKQNSKSPSNFSRISDQSSDLYKMNNSILEQYRNSSKSDSTSDTNDPARFDLRKYEYLSKSVCESSDVDISNGLFQRYFSEDKDPTISSPTTPSKPSSSSTAIPYKSPSYDFLKPISDRITKSAESSPSRHKFNALINEPFKSLLTKASPSANCDNNQLTCSDNSRNKKDQHFHSCDNISTTFIKFDESAIDTSPPAVKSLSADVEIDKLVVK